MNRKRILKTVVAGICLLLCTLTSKAQTFDLSDISYRLETPDAFYEVQWVTTGDTLRIDTIDDGGIEYVIDGFYIMHVEVTQNLWIYYMHYNPSTVKGDMLPVTNLRQSAIDSFCTAISEHTGFQWRLPTREEWEFAYNGGLFSEGYQYSGSDRASWVGWLKENSDGHPHPVGEKIANELKLKDMLGNVAERATDKGSIVFLGGDFGSTTPKGIALTQQEIPDRQGFRLVCRKALTFKDVGL